MACILFFIFPRVPITSHSFCGLFSLHRDGHTINSYMFIHTHAMQIVLNSSMIALQIFNAIALFSKMSNKWFNFYLNSQLWNLNIPNNKEVPAIKLGIPWIVPECRLSLLLKLNWLNCQINLNSCKLWFVVGVMNLSMGCVQFSSAWIMWAIDEC
jgi:hypothetical protein